MGTILKYIFYVALILVIYLVAKGIYDGKITEDTTVAAEKAEAAVDAGAEKAADTASAAAEKTADTASAAAERAQAAAHTPAARQ